MAHAALHARCDCAHTHNPTPQVHAFLHNDLLEASRVFFARAKGSFGLVASSQLDAGKLVLCALDQPMSLAVVAGGDR